MPLVTLPTFRTGGRVAALLAAALACVPAVGAQQPGATLEGRATGADRTEPLAFSLVRLLPADTAQPPLAEALTDSTGAFRFAGLAPGAYRLRVERVGYESATTDPLRVEAGATVTHTLAAPMKPVQLPELTVRVGDRCVTGAELHTEPHLAALWREAQKSVEARRAFTRQYRFSYRIRQQGELRRRIGGAQAIRVDSLVRSEPDSARAREARRLAERSASGYGQQGQTSLKLTLPNDMEILDDRFLESHCLHRTVEEKDGAWGLRFQPSAAAPDRIEVRGTIWLENDGYAVRGLDNEFVQRDRVLGSSSMRYGDVPIPGGVIRLPVEGRVSGRPGGMLGALVTGYEVAITLDEYGDFQRAEPATR